MLTGPRYYWEALKTPFEVTHGTVAMSSSPFLLPFLHLSSNQGSKSILALPALSTALPSAAQRQSPCYLSGSLSAAISLVPQKTTVL